MKPRTLAILSVAAVITASAALIATSSRNIRQLPDGSGQNAIPGLLNIINDIAGIAIQRSDETFSFVRREEGWSDEQRNGFPAQGVAIRKLLLELTQLKQTDAKTKLKKNHGQLALLDPGLEGGNASKITLKDLNGKVISSLLIGKTATGPQSGSGVYFRKTDSDQTWLSRSALAIGLKAADWLVTPIIDIKPNMVQRIVINHPNGETIMASKKTANDEHYVIENLPPNAKLESAFAADVLALALNGLELDDVAKAETISFGKDATVKTEIATFDGLKVNIELMELNRDYWIKLTASAREGSDLVKQTGELNARFAPWVYQIAGHKAENMKKRLADLLQKE